MKRYFAVILGVFLVFGLGADVLSAEIEVIDAEVSIVNPDIRITGGMPQITGLGSERFARDVNARIADVYYEFELTAIDSNAIHLDFDFEHIADGGNNFIVIYAEIVAASELRKVSVVSFNADENRFLAVEDFLGPNANCLAERHISAYMRRSPGRFNSEFAGLSQNPGFIVTDGQVEFLFNQAEIAPARFGVVHIAMDTGNVRNVSFDEGEYITVTDFMVKMIPLRQAVEGLGYSVEWNETDNSIRVINGGFETRLELGRNTYSSGGRAEPIELEAAPLLVDGVTHVPVSFFQEMLGASHSVDEARTVTISTYRQ